MTSTGSPKRKLSASFTIFEDEPGPANSKVQAPHSRLTQSAVLTPMMAQPLLKNSSSAMPLTTSKLANQLPMRASPKVRESA